MTLIEVVISMGLFAVIALASLYTTMSVKATNDIMATAIAANNSLREQTEEVHMRAVEFAYESTCGSLAKGLVLYYGDRLAQPPVKVTSDEGIRNYFDAHPDAALPVTFYNETAKTMQVRFPVLPHPDPRGGSARTGIGLMTIYLDPSTIPASMKSAQFQNAFWEQLGDSEGDDSNLIESTPVAIKNWTFSDPAGMGVGDVFVEIGVGYPLHRSISRVDVVRKEGESVAADARWMTRQIVIPDNTASLSFGSMTALLNGG